MIHNRIKFSDSNPKNQDAGENNSNGIFLGKPVGDWIYWVIATLIGFAAYYVSSQISPLASSISKMEIQIERIQNEINRDEVEITRNDSEHDSLNDQIEDIEEELAKKASLERLEIEIKHLKKDIDYVKSEHHDGKK